MYRALLFLFALQFSFSQSELKRALGEFNELKVYDGITVVLKKSNKNFLVISGENSQNVVVINKSGIMKVKMELFKRFNAENTTINIEHKSPVF